MLQQLLFHTGDPFTAACSMKPSACCARSAISTTRPSSRSATTSDNTVDVLVRVHDVWTLSPGLSFGRKGGENSTRVKFEDTNFLGLGKQMSFARSSDVDRSAWELAYVDPNVFGSWWNLSTAYSTLSDGCEKALALRASVLFAGFALERWTVAAATRPLDVSRYSLGQRVERFDMQQRQFEIGGGISSGLHDGWTTRYLGGIRYDAREFHALATTSPLASIPADRVVAYPWVGVKCIEDQYLSTRNLDQIGRTEDLYLGAARASKLGSPARLRLDSRCA